MNKPFPEQVRDDVDRRHADAAIVFFIFVADEIGFCDIFSWFCVLAFACDWNCGFLGHELREYEGAFDARIFGGADFYVAFCGNVLVAARDFA